MHVANTKKATTTNGVRRRRGRRIFFFLPLIFFGFSLPRLHFCQMPHSSGHSRISSSSSNRAFPAPQFLSSTRGCENSSLAFRKTKLYFAKKGQATLGALDELDELLRARCGWLVWAERKPNYWHLFLVLTLPSSRAPHGTWGSSSNWTTEASNALCLPNCGSKQGMRAGGLGATSCARVGVSCWRS